MDERPGDWSVEDAEAQQERDVRPRMAERLLAGWWHPITCTNEHNESGNCLDADGFITGWREQLSADLRTAHRIAAQVYHEESHPSLSPFSDCRVWPCDPLALSGGSVDEEAKERA